MTDFKRASYEKWSNEYYLTFDEDFVQKRRQMLHLILKEIIENELDDNDKLLAKMYWYDKLKVCEIALMLGLSPSYVSRHLQKCRTTIDQYMKYVFKFYKCEGRC